MSSLTQKIEKISHLVDTNDITDWQNDFIKSILDQVKRNGNSTTKLTSKQVDIICSIFERHFA